MAKMILGTVQLGMNYGINNTTGMPSEEQAIRILDTAFHQGIDMVDTADSYGESERRIGAYILQSHNEFRICTKLPTAFVPEEIGRCCAESRERIAVGQIDVYYLHRFEQCRDSCVMSELMRLKEQGDIERIGVSIYEPVELEYILENLSDVVDVVQFPFNLLDNCRWLGEGLLDRAKGAGLQLYCRSVYLQGLIFLNPESSTARRNGLDVLLHTIGWFAEECGLEIDELALAFLNSFMEIDRFVMGCETEGQLLRNVELSRKMGNYRLDGHIRDDIVKLGERTDRYIIDPRKWGGGR